MRSKITAVLLTIGATLLGVVAPTGTGAGAASPLASSFYRYTGSRPLADIAPGTVLKTRTVSYHIAGVALPLTTIQLLYRSTSSLGAPTVNVTSVLRPPVSVGAPKVVSYQSFYDSLNPADEPSVAIAGGVSLGDGIPYVETLLFAPLLLLGFTIVIPDTEGQHADFGASREYGINTLDSLRAAFRSPAVGLTSATKVGLIGYSGGAIATEWAAELAAGYAPDVSKHIVGSAFGGVFVDPLHNLHYVDGSPIWSGVMPGALVGIARGYHVDMTPYMSAYGKKLAASMQDQSIISMLGAHPGLTWSQLTLPKYSRPETIPVFVHIANELTMGTGGTPAAPVFIGQGTGGYLEGTPGNKPGLGAGDGVMVAGDVRSLAREYCARGVKVTYRQYPLSHTPSAALWAPQAYSWLLHRFSPGAAPTNCSSIAPGNPLTPAKVQTN